MWIQQWVATCDSKVRALRNWFCDKDMFGITSSWDHKTWWDLVRLGETWMEFTRRCCCTHRLLDPATDGQVAHVRRSERGPFWHQWGQCWFVSSKAPWAEEIYHLRDRWNHSCWSQLVSAGLSMTWSGSSAKISEDSVELKAILSLGIWWQYGDGLLVWSPKVSRNGLRARAKAQMRSPSNSLLSCSDQTLVIFDQSSGYKGRTAAGCAKSLLVYACFLLFIPFPKNAKAFQRCIWYIHNY